MKKIHHMTLRADDRLYRLIRRLAKRNRRSITRELENAMEEYIRRRKR